MSKPLIIVWFRQDLRIEDNPALHAAAQQGTVLPVYILDDINAREWEMGAASRWWLHHSLQALDRSLDGKLWVLQGDAGVLLPELARKYSATHITWNRCYEPWRIKRDSALKTALREQGVEVDSSNGSFLFEPGSLVKNDGTPYKVFTPYYKQALARGIDAGVLPKPVKADFASCPQVAGKIDELALLPATDWSAGIARQWQPGETGARGKLRQFLHNGLYDYRDGRDFPARRSVSGLSPHLHFGEISPRQVAASVQRQAHMEGIESQAEHFLRELIWREFSYSLLYHFPELPTTNLKPQFNHFPWRQDARLLQAWQRGQTGFPLVDAGMRELWQTGSMHNRVRMIVASFLIKNLNIDWREGARWFWDCLVDADLANNSASWQWVAGSGMDAAPYFRIFNPVTQSQKFDPEGSYIKHFVPELAGLAPKHLHNPSAAPAASLQEAGITLGENYPKAIVDLRETREQALAAYQTLREAS